MKYNISDFDFVFLSYDEPNAELLYAELNDMIPWGCKRVNGVKGFDSAHRACADVSETEYFITVDGDNRIYPEFLDLTADISDNQRHDAWTWAGRNIINGLVYGNGGLKLWSKSFVYSMKSHENSLDPAQSVDFCWSPRYHEVEGCYSETISNGSPKQAWRAGFREGVKMSLDRGNRVLPKDFHKKIWSGNITRLCIWASVGQDVENGIWAMYGARMGCFRAALTDDDYTIISDYDKMEELWQGTKSHDPLAGCLELESEIPQKLGLKITTMDPMTSKFFKGVYINPMRPFVSDNRIKHFMATRNV